MATAAQYQFFRSLYDEENYRTSILNDHAKNNISLTTLYSGFILFLTNSLSPETNMAKVVFVLGIAALASSFLLSLWTTNISDYEAVTNPEAVFRTFDDEPPRDEDFFDARIIDYSVAYERNSVVNDRKARSLYKARYFLLFGIALHGGYVLLHFVK